MAITEQHSAWQATAVGGEVETPFSASRRRPIDSDDLTNEPKWARWKVTIVVVVFCAAFWSGVGYIAMRLLG